MPPTETAYTKRLHSLADSFRLTRFPLVRACLAEACGTAILVIMGCGVLAQVTLGDHGKSAHGTFISVSLGWGMAVCLGVFYAGQNGSGNINPAVSLAFAIIGKIPFSYVPFYTVSQIFGGFIGALAIFGVYYENIYIYAAVHDGGQMFVNTTGNIFVTNPWASTTTCFFDQVLGTALLVASALAIGDMKGWGLPEYLHPLMFGFMVYALVGAFALNAGCALNPARDLGPRLMIFICGWGVSAFTAGRCYFWVPILGPYLGAIIGAVLYELTIGIHITKKGGHSKDYLGEDENNQTSEPLKERT